MDHYRVSRAIVPLLLAVLVVSPLLMNEKGPGAEIMEGTVVQYTGVVDGDGLDGDICLAGYRWYKANFTFSGANLSDIDEIRIVLSMDDVNYHLLDLVLNTSTVTQYGLAGYMDISDVEAAVMSPLNFSFGFRFFIHMIWGMGLDGIVLPRLITNGSLVDLDAFQEARFEVYGSISPTVQEITDLYGNPVSEGEILKANTSILVSGIRFFYHHPLEPFASKRPISSELEVIVYIGESAFNATLLGDGFYAEVLLPMVDSDQVIIKIEVTNVMDEWLFKVRQWEFNIELDGLSPTISLKKPATTQRVGGVEFDWEITVTDRPALSGILVNGSSVQFRTFRDGTWTPWESAGTFDDMKSFSIAGNATGTIGIGTTKLQFRASDILGNENISVEFPIHVNIPPQVSVPDEWKGRTYYTNMSLLFNGFDLVFDEDDADSDLSFEWYLDDPLSTPISTTENFEKTLFRVEPGTHTVFVVVKDRYVTETVNFTVEIEKAPEPDDHLTLSELLKNELFLAVAIICIALIGVIILVVIVIIVSKKMRKDTDFIIDEGNVMSSSEAEEIAERLRRMYGDAPRVEVSSDDAQMERDEFDFDYNLYEVLGVEPTAPDVEIKKKYRSLAAYYHPDMVGIHKEIDHKIGSEEMIRINKAKEVLLDQERRVRYDQYLSELVFSVDTDDMDDEGSSWD